MFGELQTPHVLVLGLGESGLAMARWCGRYGCALRVADTRPAPANLAFLQAELPSAEFVGGAAFASALPALLDGIALIAISPGLSPTEADTGALLDAARERSIPVWGEIELFARALAHLRTEAGYAPKLLAITGTNGKTTTTALTGRLVERAGKSVAVAGNISPSALDKLSACIASATLPDVWVLELSSFQLETTHTLAPHAAAVLNVTQDHLDWHGTMQAYAAAKQRIFGPAGAAGADGADCVQVLNRNDRLTMEMARQGTVPVTFGTDLPEVPGSFGILREGGMPWLVLAEPDGEADEARPRRRKSAAGDEAAPVPVRHKRLMPADALHIRGMHNATNAMAALALCRAIDLPLNALLHGLREYRGEPHRVEWIATIDDVEYFDDSKGTNVGATVAALSGLDKRVVLIAGGEGKGQDFSPLAAPVAQYARAVVLIGKAAGELRAALEGTGVALLDAGAQEGALEAAVRLAAEQAQAGDAVLLSPACASLDMFRNYVHRAQVFRAAVEELALSRGIMP